ncbi:uncharacterized protein K441DRAFT_693639 [Cenococcum geophilum 1.58]|uniref:uncharacterized protein n=1 Tax=Cenococcum geophilum 1.58 TaxID=794803 RepID=UPI00358DE1EB|nr:hypothetical protein K441DRAFT_693639 [Cenococcum geophilum 1.58]
MSTIPKAKSSSINALTVVPNNWDSHPRVEKSVISNCHFESLTDSTQISHSRLSNTTLVTSSAPDPAPASGAKQGKSSIDRSSLSESHITDSHIDRSVVKNATVARARLDRSNLEGSESVVESSRLDRSRVSNCSFSGTSAAERSTVSDSIVRDKSYLGRSQVNECTIAKKTRAERSILKDCKVEASWMERSRLDGCEVINCRLERTVFERMRLMNGKWERGNLVGRMGDGEVVAEKLEDWEKRERDREEMERLQEPLMPLQPGPVLRDEKTVEPDAPESLRINIAHTSEISPAADMKEHIVTSPVSEAGTSNSGVGWSTGLPDSDSQSALDAYDGPRTDTPPPPYTG